MAPGEYAGRGASRLGDVMEHQVTHYMQAHRLLSTGSTVVVAVSGGADSVALVDFLVSRAELHLRLVVAHLNHCLRGGESDGDEAFVISLAASYGIPCELRRVDVRELARTARQSLEDAGRSARYAFLDEVADSYGAHAVALAHHADDQAETVLMRLLRGSGGRGLASMSPRSRNGRYVRPFLCVTRREIEAYLQRRRLSYRHDRSNDDTGYLRNSIRHELLPFLQRYNPEIAARLADTAAILAADEDLLDASTDDSFVRCGAFDKDGAVLAVRGVRCELPGMRMRLYRRALQRVNPGLAGISHRHLDAVDGLVLSEAPNAELHLPGGCRVVRSYDGLAFRRQPAHAPAPFAVEIPGPGEYPLPNGASLVVTCADSIPDLPEDGARRALFDLDAVPFPWLVRSFRPGDRLHPAGMSGTKKVKELFMERRVPRTERGRIPLLFQGDRLLWVCGLRRSTDAVTDTHTGRPVAVEFLDELP